ncbi:hypothetical protein NPIL_530791 [Nephila pilipes]|uniref:Uncharacterized protein n=1 Tax=Nephila pilipes TaxID=299642 RepID=A0A8X6NU96_NEPPI|nr:hypothetical protein NPIL_530791 [Nephila pilipes]
MQHGKILINTNSKLDVWSVSINLFKRNINVCEGLNDEGVRTSNRENWILSSSLVKNIVLRKKIHNVFQKPIRHKEVENLDNLLDNLSHIFSEELYDMGCIRLEPQMVVLTSELLESYA